MAAPRKQHSILIRFLGPTAMLSRFESRICHLLGMWSWARDWTSLAWVSPSVKWTKTSLYLIGRVLWRWNVTRINCAWQAVIDSCCYYYRVCVKGLMGFTTLQTHSSVSAGAFLGIFPLLSLYRGSCSWGAHECPERHQSTECSLEIFKGSGHGWLFFCQNTIRDL